MKRRNYPFLLSIFFYLLVTVYLFLPDWEFLNPVEVEDSGNEMRKATSFIKGRAMEILKGVYVPFVENKGQVDESVRFYANFYEGTLFVNGKGELVYSLGGGKAPDVIRERFSGKPVIRPGRRSVTKVNYFHVNKRMTDIPSYDFIRLEGVARKVDLILKAYGGKIEKVFEIEPGGNVADIVLEVEGVKRMFIEDGRLYLVGENGSYSFSKPVFYQIVNGRKLRLKGRFELLDKNHYGFAIEDYDSSIPLYIDPVLHLAPLAEDNLASTFIGGEDLDIIYSVFVDDEGYVYITGFSRSPQYPVTSEAYSQDMLGSSDIVVSKFSNDLSTLVASTFIGGSDGEVGEDIFVDKEKNVYLVGYTFSSDFPVTSDGFDRRFSGKSDVVVCKLSGDLSQLIASTFIGGTEDDSGKSIYVTEEGKVYIVGMSSSIDFPVVYGAFNMTHSGARDVVVSVLSSDLAHVLYSTYLGGTDDDFPAELKVINDKVYIVGNTESQDFPVNNAYQSSFAGNTDGFVAIMSQDLSRLLESTLLGGGQFDYVSDLIVLDESIIVVGDTNSPDFPIPPGSSETLNGKDGFVAIFKGDLATLEMVKFLGGSGNDEAEGISVDGAGNIYITGNTSSSDFPVTGGAFDEGYNGGYKDLFIMKFDSTFENLSYSTYIGGADQDLATHIYVDVNGTVFVAGYTLSADFPTSEGAFDRVNKSPSSIWTGFVLAFINRLPDISSFYADPVSGIVPLDVNFTVEAVDPDGGDIIGYKWDFDGDGKWDKIAGTENESYTYPEPGTYTVLVSVTDSDGGTTEASLEVTALPDASGVEVAGKSGDEGGGCSCRVGEGSGSAGDFLLMIIMIFIGFIWRMRVPGWR